MPRTDVYSLRTAKRLTNTYVIYNVRERQKSGHGKVKDNAEGSIFHGKV